MNKFCFKNLNLKIVEKFKFFGAFALAVIIAGVVIVSTIGLNVGLDFAGGVKIEVNVGDYVSIHTEEKSNIEDIIKGVVKDNKFDLSYIRWSETDGGAVAEVGLNYKYKGKKIDKKNTNSQNEFTKLIQGEEGNRDNCLEYKIADAINDDYSDDKISIIPGTDISTRIVNASTFTKLLKNSIIATLVAVGVILIYVAFRFTLSSGIAAIIALLHDVLVMISLTAIFRVEINVTFIAAVITIVGYSINATIVIFDRIRELTKQESMKDKSDNEIANKAVANTLGRSILTTITTLVVIVALAIVCSIIGVSSMSEFALPIVFGLIAGAYSSVLLSASIWVYFRKIAKKIKNNKMQKGKLVK